MPSTRGGVVFMACRRATESYFIVDYHRRWYEGWRQKTPVALIGTAMAHNVPLPPPIVIGRRQEPESGHRNWDCLHSESTRDYQ